MWRDSGVLQGPPSISCVVILPWLAMGPLLPSPLSSWHHGAVRDGESGESSLSTPGAPEMSQLLFEGSSRVEAEPCLTQ